ncbi:MAG: ankyrin repeat domain-containing protein [Chryseobacterium gambrini]|nr:ankyrin repeat domain-containing protein [Chryseobacterium gambrini]
MQEELFKLIVLEKSKELEDFLKSQKVDLNQKDEFGDTPLYTACTSSNFEIVQILLKYPQNINEQCTGKCTSLYSAVQKRKTDIVKLLIEKGADVNIADKYGNTPLIESADMFKDDDTIIKLLLENGADPYQKNNYGVSVYKLLEMPRLEPIRKLFPPEK